MSEFDKTIDHERGQEIAQAWRYEAHLRAIGVYDEDAWVTWLVEQSFAAKGAIYRMCPQAGWLTDEERKTLIWEAWYLLIHNLDLRPDFDEEWIAECEEEARR